MSGRAKIEKLTNTWYGLALFSGLMTVLINGFGLGSIILGVMSTGVSIVLTFFIGRALMSKSRLTRLLMLGLSALFGVFGAIGAAKLALGFFGAWQLGMLLQAGLGGLAAYMNLKSFAVLRDREVKGYFG